MEEQGHNTISNTTTIHLKKEAKLVGAEVAIKTQGTFMNQNIVVVEEEVCVLSLRLKTNSNTCPDLAEAKGVVE